jgi:hypothetical protein
MVKIERPIKIFLVKAESSYDIVEFEKFGIEISSEELELLKELIKNPLYLEFNKDYIEKRKILLKKLENLESE